MTREEEVVATLHPHSRVHLNWNLTQSLRETKTRAHSLVDLATLPLKEPAGRVLPLAGERVSHTSSGAMLLLVYWRYVE